MPRLQFHLRSLTDFRCFPVLHSSPAFPRFFSKRSALKFCFKTGSGVFLVDLHLVASFRVRNTTSLGSDWLFICAILSSETPASRLISGGVLRQTQSAVRGITPKFRHPRSTPYHLAPSPSAIIKYGKQGHPRIRDATVSALRSFLGRKNLITVVVVAIDQEIGYPTPPSLPPSPSPPPLSPKGPTMGGISVAHQLPPHQRALILEAPGPTKSYRVVEQWPVPQFENTNEVLIRVEAAALNPVDWKSVIFGFGLPTLPAITGRDLSGIVVKVGADVTRFKVGDRVFGPSTQYRDYRTSAFQEYAIAMDHCLGRVPESLTLEECAAIGVGSTTAILAIASAFGIPIRNYAPRELSTGAEGELPEWKLRGPSRIVLGEYLLIWGASTVTGYFAAQFGRLAGLKVIAVADEKRHGERLRNIGIEHIVDRSDPIAAIAKVKEISNGGVRYAMDCVGKETAGYTIESLIETEESWVVGLSGLPKSVRAGVHLCEVPVKTFHTNPAVGRATMSFLEDLFVSDELSLPPVEVIDGGLDSINGGLARLRAGDHGFGRLVVRSN